MSFEWLTDHSREFLNRGYLLSGVKAEDRIQEIAEKAEQLLGISNFADKFYDYMSRGWYSLSSPIWSNFGLKRGLPISCYGSYVDDSMVGILETSLEVGIMSKYGGGTSAYFGDIRPRGSKIRDNGYSEGSVNFMKLFNTLIDVTKQGATRRGNFAAYLPVDHKDIEEFLLIKTEGSPIQGIFTGVTVSDEWMQSMIDGDREKRRIWAKVLQSRSEIGLPYIFFSDTVNKNAPEVYKEKGREIYASNLCSEIALSSNNEESFVCDLSSINIAKYDEWKNTDAVEVLVYFLDAVMSEFIENSKNIRGFEKAHTFAKNQRALGLGVLGWHDFLQKNMIPFDSFEATQWNNKIFKFIQERAEEATIELARLYGEPPLLEGKGRRNVTLTAIAPTTSSSFILGQTSQSIEPYRSNYYVRDLAKIKVTIKNRHLEKLLIKKGEDNDSTWDSILQNNGSVQHLDFLNDHEKKVFETFSEISQLSIIQQAAQRQKYIDQSQSLNLMIHPHTSTKDINTLYIKAWELGVKTLYYQHSVNAAQEFKQNLLNCSACES